MEPVDDQVEEVSIPLQVLVFVVNEIKQVFLEVVHGHGRVLG